MLQLLPVHLCLRLAAIAFGCGAMALNGCAHSGRAVEDDSEFATRIVTPFCADAIPSVALEMQRVSPDLRARKPSKDVRHYFVDLRIQRRDLMDLWLLVDEDTFPSAVDSAHSDAGEPGELNEPPHEPRATWWFLGNDIVRAWPLGTASERSFMNLDVSTGDTRIPVSLGTIDIEGLSPQQWVRQTGGRQPKDADHPRARASFEPHCTTWFELAAEAERSCNDGGDSENCPRVEYGK